VDGIVLSKSNKIDITQLDVNLLKQPKRNYKEGIKIVE